MKEKMKNKEKKLKKNDIYRIVGLLGILLLICSVFYYLFYTDTEIQFYDYVTFNDPVTNTPNFHFFVSLATENEFIVGQPIHIESFILFTDNQSYDEFKNSSETVLLFISGASPAEDGNNWFESSVIKFSETNDPLREELKVPFIVDKYLKGTTDVIFHQSGSHQIFTLSNGTKIPISQINISPRTVGYELKNNKIAILLALFGILLSFIGLKKSRV